MPRQVDPIRSVRSVRGIPRNSGAPYFMPLYVLPRRTFSSPPGTSTKLGWEVLGMRQVMTSICSTDSKSAFFATALNYIVYIAYTHKRKNPLFVQLNRAQAQTLVSPCTINIRETRSRLLGG